MNSRQRRQAAALEHNARYVYDQGARIVGEATRECVRERRAYSDLFRKASILPTTAAVLLSLGVYG